MIRIYEYGQVPNNEIFARDNLSAAVAEITTAAAVTMAAAAAAIDNP